MPILTAIDRIWFRVVLPAGPHCTSQISYDTVASLLRTLVVWAVQMSLYSITADCNGSLEAAHDHTDGDRYDLVEGSAAVQPQVDLSHQLRNRSTASTDTKRLSSTNELV